MKIPMGKRHSLVAHSEVCQKALVARVQKVSALRRLWRLLIF